MPPLGATDGLQALMLASELSGDRPLQNGFRAKSPPALDVGSRRSSMQPGARGSLAAFTDMDEGEARPSERLAARLTLAVCLEDLLATHPRFADAFGQLDSSARRTLRESWGGNPPEGLTGMLEDCWRQGLFDWQLVSQQVLCAKHASPASTPRARAQHRKAASQQPLCLRYASEAYGAWASLVQRVAEEGGQGTRRMWDAWHVSIAEMAKFVGDDREVRAPPAPPGTVDQTTSAPPPPMTVDRAAAAESMGAALDKTTSTVGPPTNTRRRPAVQPRVLLEGEPEVGKTLKAVHNMGATAVCTWMGSTNGWDFEPLMGGEQLLLGGCEVHSFVRADVRAGDDTVSSDIAFVNVSEAADRGLSELLASCVLSNAGAEFDVVVDDVPGSVLLALPGEDGAEHSCVTVLMEEEAGSEEKCLTAATQDCAWKGSLSRLVLTLPKHGDVELDCDTVSERDSLILCLRLFAGLSRTLVSELAEKGATCEEELAETLIARPSHQPTGAGCVATLLYRVENQMLHCS